MNFVTQGNDQFKGIINHLLTKNGGNISNQLQITFSSIGSGEAINVTHYDKNDYFQTNNFPRSYITFHFKGFSIIPKNYQIKTTNNGNYPKSWVIEASNDECNWNRIAEEQNNSLLNGPNQSHIFSVYNPDSEGYSYIRMCLSGENWNHNNCLAINSFEFYGSLK